MLYWALLFLAVALVAGLFGFGGVEHTATEISQILFVVFVVLFLASAVAGLVRRRTPVS